MGWLWEQLVGPLAPHDRPITVEQLRYQCRIPDESQDEHLALLIDSATDYVENASCQFLCPRRIRFRRTNVPQGVEALELPRGPIRGIHALSYIHPVTKTWTAWTDFEALTQRYYPLIIPKPGKEWPDADKDIVPALRVDCDVGYATVAEIPSSLRHAVLIMAQMFYQFPDGMQKDGGVSVPPIVAQLIASNTRRGYP